MPAARPLVIALGLRLATTLVAGSAMRRRDYGSSSRQKSTTESGVTTRRWAWMDANPADPATGNSALGRLNALARQQQIDLLNAAMMRSPQTANQKLLGDFWASGLDENLGGKPTGANRSRRCSNRIDGIRRDHDITPAFAAPLRSRHPVAFDFAAEHRPRRPEPQHRLLHPRAGSACGPRSTPTATPTRAADGATPHRSQDLTLAGTKPEKLRADAGAVIDIEDRIAQASRPQQAIRRIRAAATRAGRGGRAGKQYPHPRARRFLRGGA